MNLHYISPELRIDNHFWRLVVQDSRFGGRSTAHQFRLANPVAGNQFRLANPVAGKSSEWRDYHEWPTYDFNDGTYAGLPPDLQRQWDVIRVDAGIALAIGDREPIAIEQPDDDEVPKKALTRHFLSGRFLIAKSAAAIVASRGIDTVLQWFNYPRNGVTVGSTLPIDGMPLKAYFGFDRNEGGPDAFFVRIALP